MGGDEVTAVSGIVDALLGLYVGKIKYVGSSVDTGFCEGGIVCRHLEDMGGAVVIGGTVGLPRPPKNCRLILDEVGFCVGR